MRHLVILAVVLLSIAAAAPVRAQVYDEATIDAHLRELYKYHGDRLFKWDRPIRYIVAGFESEATTQLVRDQFAYLRDLTGLDIRDAEEAGEQGNFVMIFSDSYGDLAEIKTVKTIFGRDGQSVPEFRAMLEDRHRDRIDTTITKRSEYAIGFYAIMADPTRIKDELFTAHQLDIIAIGLTQTVKSAVMKPSLWNSSEGRSPLTRLPSIDEAYLRALYSPAILSGIPMDVAIPKLAAAIAADLNN